MIFFKKQHEDIAIGFLKRIDHLLRLDDKAVYGYSIDDGIETLKLRIGKSMVTLVIEGVMLSKDKPEIKGPPEGLQDCAFEDAKEVIY